MLDGPCRPGDECAAHAECFTCRVHRDEDVGVDAARLDQAAAACAEDADGVRLVDDQRRARGPAQGRVTGQRRESPSMLNNDSMTTNAAFRGAAMLVEQRASSRRRRGGTRARAAERRIASIRLA